MADILVDSVERLAIEVFGRFDREAWEATRYPAFCSFSEFKATPYATGNDNADALEWAKRREAYYQRHPSARREG